MHHSSSFPPPPPPPPLLPPQADGDSDAIQDEERWEGLLYRPYGGEVRYLSSLSPSLCLSRRPQWGSHTRCIGFESQPRLLAFHHSSLTLIRREKEIESGGGWRRGRGREREREREKEVERGGEKKKWEALGWKRSKMSERKRTGTWGETERGGAAKKKAGRRKWEIRAKGEGRMRRVSVEAKKRGSVGEERMKERERCVCVCVEHRSVGLQVNWANRNTLTNTLYSLMSYNYS